MALRSWHCLTGLCSCWPPPCPSRTCSAAAAAAPAGAYARTANTISAPPRTDAPNAATGCDRLPIDPPPLLPNDVCTTMKWVSLCRLDELTEGKGKYVEIDGFQLAVFLHQSQTHCIDNYCPHAGGNLAAGHVDETGCAVCPLHDWPFRLATGELRD